MSKRNVSDNALSKKSGGAIFRAIEELVRHEKFSRTQFFLQRTDRTHGNNTLHAQELHRVNIRAIIDFAWQDAVPAAVTGQKRHALLFQSTEHDGIRRVAERRFHANLAPIRQSAHGIEPAPANDADRRLGCGFYALRL